MRRLCVSTCVLVCILVAAVCTAPTTSLAADKDPPMIEIGLTLYEGLFQGEKPSPGGPTLLVDLRQTGDRWERVWGIARNFNVAMHTGRVVDLVTRFTPLLRTRQKIVLGRMLTSLMPEAAALVYERTGLPADSSMSRHVLALGKVAVQRAAGRLFPALKDKFNAAIQKIREDGTYDAISKEYFNFDIYGG